jgi:hypothetical protein
MRSDRGARLPTVSGFGPGGTSPALRSTATHPPKYNF